MGLKITVTMSSWSKFWTQKIQSLKSPSATFEEPGTKTGCQEQNRILCMPLSHTPPKGWAKHPSRSSGPSHGHTATLTHRRNKLSPPPQGSRRGTRVCFHYLFELVLAHVAAEEAPAARARRRVAAVEGAAPHVAHPEGVDLRPRGGVAHEWVVGRDAVERAALIAVHVDAQHLAEQRRSAGLGE